MGRRAQGSGGWRWLLCSVALAARAVAADEVLTLDDALTIARQHNVTVENAGLDVTKAERRVAAVKTLRFPKIDVSVLSAHHLTDESFTFRRGDLGTLPDGTPLPRHDEDITTTPGWATFLSTGARLPIVGQYRIGLEIDQATVAQGIAEQKLRSERQSTARDVRDQYYQILEHEAALVATEESLRFLRELNGLVARYVQQQVALEYERLDVQTKLAKAEQQALTERNAILSGKEKLNVLLGRDVDTPFRVTGIADPIEDAPPADVARQTALAQRPSIDEAKLGVEHAEYGMLITKAKFLPEVSFDVRFLSPYGVEFIPEEQATVGVYASWDVFDWGRRYQEVQEHAAAVIQAKNTMRNARSKVEAEVNDKLRDLQNARALIPAATIGQEAAREKLRVTYDRYKQRDVLLDDLLKAESKVADAARDMADARLKVWSANAALTHALGEE